MGEGARLALKRPRSEFTCVGFLDGILIVTNSCGLANGGPPKLQKYYRSTTCYYLCCEQSLMGGTGQDQEHGECTFQ